MRQTRVTNLSRFLVSLHQTNQQTLFLKADESKTIDERLVSTEMALAAKRGVISLTPLESSGRQPAQPKTRRRSKTA